jgi:hypothetical protein
MQLFKILLVSLVLLVNLVIAQPSWADRPNLTLLPEYTEVTQKLNDLLQAKYSPEELSYTPEQIQKQIGELQLQKYILESARGLAQCRNAVGKTIGVYAHKPQKSAPAREGSLFFLGDGQITENEWNCDGVYLPTGAKIAGLNLEQPLTEPLVFKIVPGTKLVATSNPVNGTIEFNVPPAKLLKAGDGNLLIPNFSLEQIEAQVPNASIED